MKSHYLEMSIINEFTEYKQQIHSSNTGLR